MNLFRLNTRYFYLILTFFILMMTACSSNRPFTKRDVKRAQKLIGLHFQDEEIEVMYPYLRRNLEGYDTMRTYHLDNSTFPAILFDPLPHGFKFPIEQEACIWTSQEDLVRPDKLQDLAFATVGELGHLIRTRQVSSLELTEMYLDRIRKYDGILHSVITLMESRAILQAKALDEELADGNYRGPLHGIPYGVKDLVSVPGYPTTWGSVPYKNQKLDETATIIDKLEESGAVLLAKLTSGALARGDVWFGGQTKNPWDTLQGASGSSAGSGSATSAGLVGFSIGTETLGSITSPSNRNGVTGLRPTYGRVSRYGVMSLSWTMDKIGPICRSAEDCAIVFSVIHGLDPKDPTTYDVPFCFDRAPDPEELRVGYFRTIIEKDTTDAGENIRNILPLFDSLNINLIEDSLPGNFPFQVFDIILRAEAGAFFDDMIRDGRVDKMVQQDQRSRANSLRQSRFIPAVEYIQANRYRRVLIEAMDDLFEKYDVIITPTFGRQLLVTNLTGHPVVTMPIGLDKKGRPTSISILGRLFEEEKILALARAFQDITDFDERYPPLFIMK